MQSESNQICFQWNYPTLAFTERFAILCETVSTLRYRVDLSCRFALSSVSRFDGNTFTELNERVYSKQSRRK